MPPQVHLSEKCSLTWSALEYIPHVTMQEDCGAACHTPLHTTNVVMTHCVVVPPIVVVSEFTSSMAVSTLHVKWKH